MTLTRWLVLCLACLVAIPFSHAQAPSVLYTWDDSGNVSPNVEGWAKNFGTNTVTLDNSVFGELRIVETDGLGSDVALSDGPNRVRESSTAASGGTDLTGLDWLEFDLGHNGTSDVNVQFYVQASTGYTYRALGPDLAVSPGMNTYQVPLSSLSAAEAVYLRTMGFNVRTHAAQPNLTWTLREVRSGGTPLTERDLITHDTGTPEGGLQGVIANFDVSAILGNNGGQNQTGLSHNSSGSGSLQWTDLGGQNGAAISWGNGTAWNSNTFNNRTTDLSNYQTMIVRMSASDPQSGGGTLGVQGFFQKNGFSFQSAQGGVGEDLPIDGLFHDLEFDLSGLTDMNVVEQTGINLFAHAQDLVINVDNVRFLVPEPSCSAVVALIALGAGWHGRRRRFTER